MSRDESNPYEPPQRQMVSDLPPTTVRLKLLKTAFLTTSAILASTFAAAFLDYGRYYERFQQDGLLGFLSLPSLVVFQLGYVLGIGVLFKHIVSLTDLHAWRVVGVLMGGAILAYIVSLFLLREASTGGVFGSGAAFIVVVFGILPSAAFLFLFVPSVLLYAIART